MTFRDLPKQWPDMPVAGVQHTADVLDIFVGMQDRVRGGTFVLLCDEQRRPVQPVMISNEPDEPAPRPPEMFDGLQRMAKGLADMVPGATVLVAIARDGALRPSILDRAWADVVTRAFASHVELIGIHLITPRGSTPLSEGAEQAA